MLLILGKFIFLVDLLCVVSKIDFLYSDKECSTISDYDVILFEGILAFVHESHRAMMDMKLFVDTDADLRLARRGLL